MSYAAVDPQIRRWVERHALTLCESWAGGEIRAIYVSSVAGECFQIWIEAPIDGFVRIGAVGIEARRDDEPPQDWRVPLSAFEDALDAAFLTVTGWMEPSVRFVPPLPQS